MTPTFTTAEGAGDTYTDPRIRDVELRRRGGAFELWARRPPGGPGEPEQWMLAQAFPVLDAEEGRRVDALMARAVAQCLFDALSRDNPAWHEHAARFGEHPGCTIETTCDACFCCSSAGTPGCRCDHCRCGEPGPETGHAFVPLEVSVLAAARELAAAARAAPDAHGS